MYKRIIIFFLLAVLVLGASLFKAAKVKNNSNFNFINSNCLSEKRTSSKLNVQELSNDATVPITSPQVQILYEVQHQVDVLVRIFNHSITLFY